MSSRVQEALVVIPALATTIASSWVPRKAYVTLGDIMGCEDGCYVAAGGWPFVYAVDGMASSPVGSADALGILLGLDKIRWEMFALNFGVWIVAFSLVAIAFSKRN